MYNLSGDNPLIRNLLRRLRFNNLRFNNLRFNNLRFKWQLLTRGVPFYQDLTNRLYDVYLNHHRIIHWRDGYPVYSLSTPAFFSPPMANFISRNFYGILQGRKTPNMMSFAITDRCDLDCPQCSFATVQDQENKKQPLSYDECCRVIREAQDMGVSVINLTGGEPMVFEGLEDLIRTVDKTVSTVILFTYGGGLERRAAGLKKAGLDGLYVSIDGPDAKTHDQLRGTDGIFEQAMRGVRAAQRAGLTVGFSVCAWPDSLQTGTLPRIIDLGRAMKVHEILVFAAAPSGKLKDNRELDETDWIDEIITYSERYRFDDRYPGLLIYPYNASYRSVGCSGGSRWFYVTPYGEITPCDFNHFVAGNVRDKPLHLIWDELSNLPPYQRTAWTGCKLRDPNYRSGPFSEYVRP